MKFIVLVALFFLLMFAELMTGSADISFSELSACILGENVSEKTKIILLDYRLPKLLTAILAGTGLAVSGLQMQTVFKNPLAGPYVLGVSSGASLGVMVLMLFRSQQFIGGAETALAAFLGAFSVLLLMLATASRLKNSAALLIAGIMTGSAASGLTSILTYFGSAEQVKSLTLWSFGSLSSASFEGIFLMFLACTIGFLSAFYERKSLNLLLLGDDYARSLGVNVKKTRMVILCGTALMSGSITAFCGPIGFIGLMTPHVARMFFATSNHAILLPACLVLGAVILMLCDLTAQLPGTSSVLPINAVTALLGAPFVFRLILTEKKL
jgi:iron complex transport system permease protein